MPSAWLAKACLIGSFAFAAAAQEPSGMWLSDPSPSEGDLVVEFFGDGTALVSELDDGRVRTSFTATVKPTDTPKRFQLAMARESGPTFEMKSDKIALLEGPSGKVCRMVRSDTDK